MTTRPDHDISPAAYRLGVVRLREAAEWNRHDAAFHGSRGVIVPVVDANVVKLFLDPEQSADRIYVFGRAKKPVDAEPDPVLTTFAAVTAEFLFLSQALPIGGQTGQLWRETPRLAPAHGAEVSSMLHEILRKGRQPGPQRRQVDIASEVIDEYTNKLADLASLSRHEQLKLVRSVPRALSGLFSGPLLEAVRWLRLSKENQILPLAELAEISGGNLLDPLPSSVNKWFLPILRHKQSKAEEREQDQSDVETLAYHDALVLTQVIALNQHLRTQSGQERPRRAVLITGDDAVHDVYQNEFWSSDQTLDLDAYVLRRPSQYVPILNCNQIPNGYEMAGLFEQLISVLDMSVDSFMEATSRGMYALEYDFSKCASNANRSRVGDKIREQLLNLWREATDISTALCAGLAVRDYAALLERFGKIALSKSRVNALVTLETQVFSDIEGVQLPLIVQELVAMASRRHQEGRDAIGLAKHRTPALLAEAFDDITGNVSLDDYLVGLTKPGAREALHKTLGGLLVAGRRHRAFFFAGAIAVSANRYGPADRYLRRALVVSEGTPEVHEIAYLAAVSRRMTLRSHEDYQLACEDLNRLVDSKGLDSFAMARARSERASLHLMGYFVAVLGEPKESAAESPQALLDKARGDLNWVRGQLSGRLSLEMRTDPERYNELIVQVLTNSLCESVVRTRFFEGLSDKFEPAAGDILNSLKAGPDAHTDHIVRLWIELAQCFLAFGDERKHLVAELGQWAQTMLNVQQPDDFWIDRKAFEYVAKHAGRLTMKVS